MSVAGFIQPLRPVRCRTPAGAWLLPSGGFRGEPPVPLWRGEHARRGGNMVYPYFCADCGAFALFRFRSPGPFPVFEAPLRHLRRYSGGFSGDRGSPFAIPACSGRHSGATRFAGYGQCKPVGISPPALCPFTCVSRIRSVIRTSGRLNCLCPFAVYLRGFRSPASRRCRASYRATRFAGYGVCKPIGFTPPAEFAFRVVESSSYLHPTRCAWCCSAPYVAAPSSRSLAIGKVLSPVQATIRVVYRLVSGATRFAGYGRWHSSRRSLLLGFHLF